MKPCPFCGGSASIETFSVDHCIYHDVTWRRIHCQCIAALEQLAEEPEAEIVLAWNQRALVGVSWMPIADALQDGTRLMLWDSVSKRPVFGSWRGDNPKITHYAAEPAGPEVA
nr:Lar family restriction alleviation protein [Stenotrophomonas maltophilia]